MGDRRTRSKLTTSSKTTTRASLLEQPTQTKGSNQQPQPYHATTERLHPIPKTQTAARYSRNATPIRPKRVQSSPMVREQPTFLPTTATTPTPTISTSPTTSTTSTAIRQQLQPTKLPTQIYRLTPRYHTPKTDHKTRQPQHPHIIPVYLPHKYPLPTRTLRHVASTPPTVPQPTRHNHTPRQLPDR